MHWLFLTSVCAGFSIWATHFIAMLGYRPGVPVRFDATLTIVSALTAIAGTAIGLVLARMRGRLAAAICGGGMIGLAICVMHYLGMFAYRPDGIVRWLPGYVALSVVCAMAFSAIAVDRVRAKHKRAMGPAWDATLLLMAAILILHFVGMAAFVVVPIDGIGRGANSEVFTAMAAAIAVAAVVIVGTGVSTHLVEESRVEVQDRLRQLALHDMLTGLSNRYSFVTQLAEDCERLVSGGQPFTVLMIDLDRFKAINDTLGHPVGDLLLKTVALRLRRAARASDTVARIGGDEFAIIARNVANRSEARVLAEKIVESLSWPFMLEGHVAEIGASVGVTLAPADSTDAESLTQQADIALYRAKNEGRGRTCLFDPSQTREMLERCALENELRLAWSNQSIEVAFQPILDVRSARFAGAEALLRWRSPTRGEVPPGVFIPVAEEMGLISAIGEMVLETACEAAASWPEDLVVSVNVSPIQIMSGKLLDLVRQVLARSGLRPDRLVIEITETSLLGNDDVVLRTLQELRALGLRITLDDFGTGYSSLGYLHRFPIDAIKIDRSFIANLPGDTGSASIVRAMLQLGANLHLDVTAEGIENEAQLAYVAAHGCTHVQGFLFSEPLEGETVALLFEGYRQAQSGERSMASALREAPRRVSIVTG
ncbi:putative bifunctional diguanylate cyclase/phosphodiesterase [Novosphingobium sp.]|uniref:putative bifunctional diguanylate cyclase/phosphodiesterase n=1 Tax=Novosphingobium sp. TaxID=1874826 RepID=UPI003BAD5CE1